MDTDSVFVVGVILGILLGALITIVFGVWATNAADFVCESHGLERIGYETSFGEFSKVECGNKKPELQYDDYKVFTK